VHNVGLLYWYTTMHGQQNINLLKSTGYVMHQHVEHSTTVRSAHTVFMCFVFTWDSDLWNLHSKRIGFYNRDEKCLQRGTDWVFK
jgi:hypothetical protein